MLPIDPKERVTALVLAKDSAPGMFMVMATSKGIVKKTTLDKFAVVRSSGLIAMKLRGDEELVAADAVSDSDEVILVTQDGQAIKFPVKSLRSASRASGGVRGIKLGAADRLVAMGTIFPDAHLLTVTENGFGKRSRLRSYPLQARGGKGLRAHKVTEKTGRVIAAKLIPPGQHVIIISANGIVIRISVDEEIRLQGRDTQGVHLNKLAPDDAVASIAYLGVGDDVQDDTATTE